MKELIERKLSKRSRILREGVFIVAKSYKPMTETSSKNRPCLRCFHCKTRVFRDSSELEDWCFKRELPLSVAWKKRFRRFKKLKVYWCIKSHKKPRIFKVSDLPFITNCKLFDGAAIDLWE